MLFVGRHVSKLSGYAPAVPTPFQDNGAVDDAALERFCDLQVREGATALVVCGTTGEAPTLSRAEHDRIVRIAVNVASRRVPVIAGAGSNATSHAIELAKDAESAGADAILAVVPYYNKPTQVGMRAHFCEIAGSIDLPIILYDVPSRTGCALADETVARLAENPQFLGLKDATADMARPLRLRALVGSEFRLMSGDDHTAMAFMAVGGNGCISVTSNVAPGLMPPDVPGTEAWPYQGGPTLCNRHHDFDCCAVQRDQSSASQICADFCQTSCQRGFACLSLDLATTASGDRVDIDLFARTLCR